MTQKMQYDTSLGGKEELPAHISLIEFTSARATEIQGMKRAISSSSCTKLVFQRLPKHMRRRVMSHNVKRLPRALHEIHLRQLEKSGMPPKQKRSSRKYRRRPTNLVGNYKRRKSGINWLESHIWHAKRFHMIKKWGFKLPDKPCDKSFRACYRATTSHCLAQDISYFSCIEIIGTVVAIKTGFLKMTNSSSSLSITATAHITGKRQGSIVLFQRDREQAVGTVFFNWKPEKLGKPERTLWIWVHPAFYLETLNLLNECFPADLLVQITEQSHKLNRFRLTGPLAPAILQKVLVAPTYTDNAWFNDFDKTTFKLQWEYWKKSVDNYIPSNLVLTLIVKDPRNNFPKNKTKAWHTKGDKIRLERFSELALGPIWDRNVREYVKSTKLSNMKFLKLKSQMLIPGEKINERSLNVIPIMLIYNLQGWDLVVPAGWGQTFWLSLIMWGGRAGGLREFECTRFENKKLPFLEPDTEAGRDEEEFITEIYKKRYFGLPPQKRPNYTKLGFIEPFVYKWKQLVKEWALISDTVNRFFVLRDRLSLMKIQELLRQETSGSPMYLNCSDECLIPVHLKMVHKGEIKRFARICLPHLSDLKNKLEPTETMKKDPNIYLRKFMRATHKQRLKRLKTQRRVARQKGLIILRNKFILLEYQKKMRKLWMPDVTDKKIQMFVSRQVIGYVTFGAFSFTEAHPCGVGYIAFGALRSLFILPEKNKVLVRNITSLHYRMAYLDVCY